MFIAFGIVMILCGIGMLTEAVMSIKRGYTSKPKFGEGIYRSEDPKGFRDKVGGLFIGGTVFLLFAAFIFYIEATS